MEINVFAILKEYFPARFEVQEPVDNVDGLKLFLQRRNPAAAELLSICRFAVGDEIAGAACPLQDSDIVFVLPPGSGG
jgi:molybdopterin converting factor small subunit